MIRPKFPEWKETLVAIVRSIPEWNDTLLKLKESTSPLMSGLKTIDDAAITLVIQQMLQHYVKIERKTVKAELLKKLTELHQSEIIDDNKFHQAKDYIDPILTWLYHPNNWMVRSSQPVNLHHFISDSFRYLDALCIHIQEGKMDPFFRQMETFIDEEFEEQVSEMLEANTKKLTLLLSNHFADLIEHLPFTDTYDILLKKVLQQIDGWCESDKTRQEQKRLVDDAEKADSARPTNIDDIESQKTAQKLLELVDLDGGKEKYLYNEFLRAYGKHPSCHPLISKSLCPDSEGTSEKNEDQIFSDLVDKLFPIFLPKKKCILPHGLEVEVNGLSKLIQKIGFTDRIEALKKLAMDEFESVLEASDVKDKENFREYFLTLTHILAVEYIQGKLKTILSLELQKLFNKLASKQYLDYLAVEYIFPSLIDKILEGFIRAHIERQSRRIAPFLHQILEAEDDVRDSHHALIEYLYTSVNRELIDFNMDEAGIDKIHFVEIVQPVITEIYDFIAIKKDEHPSESFSLSDVRNCLQQYYKYETVPVNHDYGRLIMGALFKVGTFGGWLSEKVIGWFQGTLSEVTSQTLHPISKDHQMLVETIVESTSRNLLSIRAIRESLFFDEPSVDELKRQSQQVTEQFPLHLRRISALTHDLIYRSLEMRSEPWVQHFTPTTTKINSVIQDVFQNLLGNPTLNISLLASFADIIKGGLEKSTVDLEAHRLLQERVAILESE